MSSQSSGSPALRIGALFGLGWGVLLIANYFLTQVEGVRFTTVASYIIALVVYLVAGILAASQTGLVRTGLLAGLWTGLISSVVNAIGVTIILLTDHALVEQMRQAALHAAQAAGASAPQLTDQVIILGSVLALVLEIIAATVIGLGVGALGGLIGKSRNSRTPGTAAPQMYQESLYRSPTAQQEQAPQDNPPQ